MRACETLSADDKGTATRKGASQNYRSTGYYDSGVTIVNFMLGITPFPVLSALLWIVLIVGALYLIRRTAHQTITATAQALHRAFRLASRGVARSEKALMTRNREVLLAQGREAKERIIEREFDRINETVRKDLVVDPKHTDTEGT